MVVSHRSHRSHRSRRQQSRPLPFGMVLFALVLGWFAAAPATACGGFFCQNSPVDQVAERIVFTVNDDDTITSLIEIAYQGEADDFSWILPIPEAIGADDLQVPDDGELVFDELHQLTDVQFIPPPISSCVESIRNEMMMATAEDDASEGVEVFASGEVGPFGFDVIGSSSPSALTDWLSANDYRVTDEMIPLIDLYVEEEFAFVAMRLLDGEDANSIQPIEITYPGTKPMIPIRLTAVAAFPEMPIYAWILADAQAVPENYVHFEVATEEITFTSFGFPDYQFLVQARANAVGGRGFITEFAGPAASLDLQHPYLVQQSESQPYLTRLATYLDPEEMTVDPVFGFDPDRADVSNVRDASGLDGLYDCERQDRGFFSNNSDAVDPRVVDAGLASGSIDDYDDLLVEARLRSGLSELLDDDEVAPETEPANTDDDEAIGEIDNDADGASPLPLLVIVALAPIVIGLGFVAGKRTRTI